MSAPIYPRGSEWRKWDLQAHTPFSALNNGFGSDFPAFAKQLIERACKDGIAVVGITDYFTIQGYTALKTLLADESALNALLGEELATRASEIPRFLSYSSAKAHSSKSLHWNTGIRTLAPETYVHAQTIPGFSS